MNKKGLSTIVITLILIVLGLVAIGVIWAVVSNVLKSQTQQANFQFGTLFLDLTIDKVLLQGTDVLVTISRGTGDGDLRGIDFIISDGVNSKIIERDTTITKLGSQTFTFTSTELAELSSIMKIEIAPVINSGGNNQIGNKVDTKKSDYYSSCLKILKAGQSAGDGIYTIDVDGMGTESSFQVYCDMTTDGGGWTLAVVCRPEDNPNYPAYNGAVPGSDCWNPEAVGETLNPASTASTKLSDVIIKSILNNGDKMTRGHWTQEYRYNDLNPLDIFIYNQITDPNQWTSNGGGTVGKQFYVKYNYADSWSPALSTLSVGCASPSNGWSNQHYSETRGESCGYYGAWDASCEAGPSSSHCCSCVTYDERANVIVYIR